MRPQLWSDKLAIRTSRRAMETGCRQAEKMGIQRLHARECGQGRGEAMLRLSGRRVAHRAGDHERSLAIKVAYHKPKVGMIGDVTEIERPQAQKTDDVGALNDGKTRGCWAVVVAIP